VAYFFGPPCIIMYCIICVKHNSANYASVLRLHRGRTQRHHALNDVIGSARSLASAGISGCQRADRHLSRPCQTAGRHHLSAMAVRPGFDLGCHGCYQTPTSQPLPSLQLLQLRLQLPGRKSNTLISQPHSHFSRSL